MKWRVNEMSDKFSPIPFNAVEESKTVAVERVDINSVNDKMNELENRIVNIEVKLNNILNKLNDIDDKIDNKFDDVVERLRNIYILI